jgi:hypothetical protein
MLDFVLANPELPRQAEARKLRALVQEEMDAWSAKAKRLGLGALSGRGQNVEEIIGAIVADMFIVGDVRDLAIQFWYFANGRETDPVIVALSAIGVVTTVVPEVDWAPGLLKVARRTGAMTKEFGRFLVELARQTRRTRSAKRAVECLQDTKLLAKRLGPSGALGVMRFVETGSDMKTAAKFADRAPQAAYAALAAGGRDTLRLLEREGIEQGSEIAIVAAKRGPKGVSIAAKMDPNLFRAHFGVGAVKSVWKGNFTKAATLALSQLGRSNLLTIWAVLALALVGAVAWLVGPVVRWSVRLARNKGTT